MLYVVDQGLSAEISRLSFLETYSGRRDRTYNIPTLRQFVGTQISSQLSRQAQFILEDKLPLLVSAMACIPKDPIWRPLQPLTALQTPRYPGPNTQFLANTIWGPLFLVNPPMYNCGVPNKFSFPWGNDTP